MVRAVTPIAGFDAENRDTEDTTGIKLGTRVAGDDGYDYIRVLASGAVPAGACTVDLNTFLVTSAAGTYTNDVAFADAQYGWVKKA